MKLDWALRTRLICETGGINRLGELAQETEVRRVLLITDAGIVAAGHAPHVVNLLESSGLTVTVFDAVPENPTTDTINACTEVAHAVAPELLVGLGGGSALDTAKGTNFLYTNGGKMSDYRGYGKATNPMLPLIAIPTTAGTGSEMQSYAVIADAETHQKMACGDPKAAPRVALLDAELTLTCPRRVTACAGMDAIVHAVETAVTRKRNSISWGFSQEAFRLLLPNFARVLERPDDRPAREALLLGAALAGMAIESSMLGAAHSAANPLTAHFNIVHGQAVGMLLPFVVAFNAQDVPTARIYNELWQNVTGNESRIEAFIEQLHNCLRVAGFPPSLAECGVTEDAIPQLAKEAAAQWTAQFNPRPLTETDFATLYRNAL